MQWIYLFLFTLTLLVPQRIRPDFPLSGRHENFESAAIFLLGVIGFSIAYFHERAFQRHLSEKKKYQREANDASRDLVHSYSYIGAVNRQLEVLKKVAVSLPLMKRGMVNDKKREQLFDTTLEAITMFARTENASLHFVRVKQQTLELTVEIGKNSFTLPVKELLAQKTESKQYEKGWVLSLVHALDGYRVFLLLDQDSIPAENLGFLKALLSQVLMVFVHLKEKS